MLLDSSPASPSVLTTRRAVVALAVIAVVQAAIIARLLTTSRGEANTSAAVTIESSRDGDVVTVDGREVGVTPHRLTVDSSMRAIGLSAPRPRPPDALSATAPADTANPAVGGLSVASPIELHVLEGQRVLGSSANGPVVATAGVHHLDLVNSAIGYRERRTVEIVAGQIQSITVKPPDGRLTIDAPPGGQVWIDGTLAGETPLAALDLPPGPHEFVFRHPQLGEHRETAMVKSGVPTRISITQSR